MIYYKLIKMIEIFKENKRFNIPTKEQYQIGYFNGKRQIKSLERKMDMGRCKNRLIKEKILNITIHFGYYHCSIGFIHRLFAETFIPNPENKRCINHRDGNKLNNLYHKDGKFNLEWCTDGENQVHSYVVLNRKPINKGKFGKFNHLSKRVGQYDLNGNLIKERDCINDILRELGYGNISRCCLKKTKQEYNFIRKYIK